MSGAMADDTATTGPKPLLAGRVSVPSGVPGLDLVHFLRYTTDDGLPFEGEWSTTITSSDIAVQKCKFRTLHAAAFFAARIASMCDWTSPYDELAARASTDAEWAKAIRHAEAHAHEIDAVWPTGTLIPFSNGPSIVDDDGTTRAYLRGQPSIDWKKDEAGDWRCEVCGESPRIVFDWMS